jgi:hypothetical protein
MLGCREKSLILSSMAAVATHYLALLIWPAVFYYFARKGLREIPKAFLTILPFLLLSLYQYLVRGDPLYYIHGYVHTSYWTARGGFLSYPFATVPYVLENYGRFSLLLLVSTFTLYIFALFMSIKRRDLQSAVFSAPFVVFIIFLGPTGFFFVPRYAEFAFPSLFSFGRLTNNRIVRIFLFLVVLLSVAYSFFRGLSPPA